MDRTEVFFHPPPLLKQNQLDSAIFLPVRLISAMIKKSMEAKVRALISTPTGILPPAFSTAILCRQIVANEEYACLNSSSELLSKSWILLLITSSSISKTYLMFTLSNKHHGNKSYALTIVSDNASHDNPLPTL